MGYSKCAFLNRRLAGGRTGREKRHRVTPGSGRNSWGVPDRCPADDTDRNSGPSGVFVLRQDIYRLDLIEKGKEYET